MPKSNFSKKLALSLGVLAMIFSLSYLVMAWTEPSTAPPTPNIDAPINVGTSTQIKSGNLGVNGLLVAYSGLTVKNKKITDLLTPTDDNDAANKAYVDALMCNGGGGGSSSMPLQGQTTIYSDAGSQPISTVPISLPKANCLIKFTVCGTPPPTQLTIGADPVARIPRPVWNLGPKGSITPGVGCPVPSHDWAQQDPAYQGAVCGSPISACYYMTGFEESSVAQLRCPTGFNSCRRSSYWSACAPSAAESVCPFFSTNNSSVYYMTLSATYPNPDCKHGYPYADPRCPGANPGTVYAAYDDTDFVCAYCPTDHPIYDPVSKNCIKASNVGTITIGSKCSTLSTILTAAFTDVTFITAAGTPSETAYYVGMAYSCPE